MNPPASEPTHCASCGRVIRLALDGYVMDPVRGYFCRSCSPLPTDLLPGRSRAPREAEARAGGGSAARADQAVAALKERRAPAEQRGSPEVAAVQERGEQIRTACASLTSLKARLAAAGLLALGAGQRL